MLAFTEDSAPCS